MEAQVTFRIARDFSRYPAGRFRSDGPWSGEKFRDDFLMPLLKKEVHRVVVELDGTAGYGSSFLEEAFGGAVRELRLNGDDAIKRIELLSEDDSLIKEVQQYMRDAAKKNEH
jgi:hypothetical protein